MTYWHMQLHDNDTIEKLHEEKTIQIPHSSDAIDIALGDIILLRKGTSPKALVEVMGEPQENSRQDTNYDSQRKVKILDILKHGKNDFPSTKGLLRKVVEINKEPYDYIDAWYHTIAGLKICTITIHSYKTLNHFMLNCCDSNNKPLPIIVIAGKNGMGKTSLLDYIAHVVPEGLNGIYDISYILDNQEYSRLQNHMTYGAGIHYNIPNFLDHLIYIPAQITTQEEMDSLNALLLEYIDHCIYDKGFTALKAYKMLQDDMNAIFHDFELTFKFKKIDSKSKISLFESKNGTEFSANELSTGEKTLLFKIFNLYLQKARNKVILIDEPELSLHPAWQNKVLKLYENFAIKNNCQIIIATHSPHIIAQTPHNYLRILVQEEGKIVARQFDGSPLDRDINTILKTIMGADYLPSWLEEYHLKYQKFCFEGKKESAEAKALEAKILEFESPNSAFFQGLAFDMELMG